MSILYNFTICCYGFVLAFNNFRCAPCASFIILSSKEGHFGGTTTNIVNKFWSLVLTPFRSFYNEVLSRAEVSAGCCMHLV